MKKLKKNNIGITLIALVITILIIIILATVTINLALGDNGLINMAELARDSYANDTEYEGEAGANLVSYMNEYIAGLNSEKENPALSADEIQQNPTAYYGAEVIGYSTDHSETSGAVATWRIFYADENNIYLIADDYISAQYAPDGKGGSAIFQNSEYKLSFDDIVDDYEGASDIGASSPARKWIDTYLNSNGTSTKVNMKAVAYMLDTNVWGIYAGSKAEYAIGGPTLEMFCASYKDTHSSRYLECASVTSSGYQIKWSDSTYEYEVDGLSTNEYHSIYIKSDSSLADGMWLASPAYSIQYLFFADCNGGLNYDKYNHTYPGLRPLVCLKSSVQLEQVDSDTFRIVP